MKKLIRLTESDLHNIIENTVRRVLKESEEPYDWDNLDDERKDFENFTSWRNKDEIDKLDRAMTKPKYARTPEDNEAISRCLIDKECFPNGNTDNAKRSWDWGYKSGIRNESKLRRIDKGIHCKGVDKNNFRK
jgi:hypothetical protein